MILLGRFCVRFSHHDSSSKVIYKMEQWKLWKWWNSVMQSGLSLFSKGGQKWNIPIDDAKILVTIVEGIIVVR